MPNRSLALLILFFLIACKESKKEPVLTPFHLANLPAEWVQLTKTDSGYIVFNSCEMGITLLTISKKKNNPGLFLSGIQEDYNFEILESHQLNDTVFIKTRWKDSKEIQDFKFVWVDKAKQIGRWITQFSNGTLNDNVYVTATAQNHFPKVEEPCRNCNSVEVCNFIARLENVNAHPVDSIKRIFDDYVNSTDPSATQEDKIAMTRGLERLQTVSDTAALNLLVNVWMYYDPTDFPTRDLINRILKQNKTASIKAVKRRQQNKQTGEMEDNAPFSELDYLLSELEKG